MLLSSVSVIEPVVTVVDLNGSGVFVFGLGKASGRVPGGVLFFMQPGRS